MDRTSAGDGRPGRDAGTAEQPRTDAGAHAETDGGAHIGAHTGTHTRTDAGAHTGTHTRTDTRTDTGAYA